MHYGKVMLRLQRGGVSGKQLRSFHLCMGRLLITGYNNQLPGNIGAWKKPAGGFETDERIWNNLDQEFFRDAGFTIWPHSLHSAFMVADLPSLSGFGYALPSCGKDGVESLCQFHYTVCIVLSVYSTLSNIYG